ncbi:TetR/AcrR family transcriptional regulator [Mycobacterium sp. M26]|uniref:TetR/AcrR family transcriptional regulator n=1 Tax=Mycobacterium sp. M26 TaxID=1762962 RepID=UPI0009EA9DCC|nr:TetR/AcrR family transcriptional regulator [Mycobacterium sp. M26]
MRTRGWGGSAPASDEEAIERILDASDAVIKSDEGEFNVAKVARALGISRQTVYNHFPGTGALLEAVAVRAAVRFSDRITEHLAGVTDPVEALLEALAFTIDFLAEQKGIRLLFSYDLPRASQRITSTEVIQFNRDLLQRLDVDWRAAGIGDVQLEEICEYMLRIIELVMVDPADLRTGKALRAYLRRWVGPVFRSEVDAHRPLATRRRHRTVAASSVKSTTRSRR